MNKLLMKVAGIALGLSLATGIGVAVGGRQAKAAEAGTESHTVSVNIGEMVDDNGWTRSASSTVNTKQTSLILDSHITVSTAGTHDNEGSFWGSGNTTDWRLYNGGLTSGCGTFTITATDATLTSMTVKYTVGNSGTLATSAGTSKTKAVTSNAATSISGTSVTYYVANTGTKTNGQVKITDISVTYATETSDTLSSINLAATSQGTTALTTATVKTDKTIQVYLTGNYSQAGAVDKTDDATWTATDGTGSATVSKGLITGKTVGTVTISASYGGLTAVSLTLTVTQGPSVTLSRTQVTPFLEKEVKNDIEISTIGFSGTPSLTASSNSANVSASISGNYLIITAANTVSADETVTITVTGNDGVDTASAELKVYLKAPVFTLSASELNIKPSASPVVITSTISHFGDGLTVTAVSGDTDVFTVSVSETTITVTPVDEGEANLTVTASSTSPAISRQVIVPVTIADVLEYNLITDASSLTDGSQLIIAATDSHGSYGMGAVSGSVRGTASVSIANNKISGPSSDVKIVTLEGETDAWYLNTDEGYLSYSGSSNNISVSATKTAAALWYISISSNEATIESNNVAGRKLQFNYNNGSPRFACYSSSQVLPNIYGIIAAEKAVVGSRMVAGTVSAKTGDNEWTLSGFKFFVTYEGESETEVTSNTTFAVTESVPTINANGSMDVTVTPTYKGVEYTAKAEEVSATLTYVDPYSIAHLYDIELALDGTQANLTCDGIYMGYITHISSGTTYYDIFIGNGDYGIEVYAATTSKPAYTIGETYLTVTGTLKNFNYLYEMTSATVSVLNDSTRKSHVATPSTYVVDGTESASTLYLANRKTSLSGTVYSIGGVTTAGTTATSGSNNSILVTVGGNNVLLYVKTAQATPEVAAKFVVGNPITVEGFTTYYKSNNVATFEVLFETVVDVDENYHSADFARELLKMTRSICAANDEGNGSSLTSVWTTLAGADHWLKVEAAGEEDDLILGTPDKTIVVPNTDAEIDEMSDADAIAAALYRYDWCTAKYDLTNFIGRKLTVSFNRAMLPTLAENESTGAIVTVITLTSVAAVGGFFFLRKRRLFK